MERRDIDIAVYQYRKENRGYRPTILIIHPEKASKLLIELREQSVNSSYPIMLQKNNIIISEGCELKVYRSFDIDPKKVIVK